MMRKHKHSYRLTAVQHTTTAITALGMGVAQTIILYRCEEPQGPDCVVTSTVDGKWTMADLVRLYPAGRHAEPVPAG